MMKKTMLILVFMFSICTSVSANEMQPSVVCTTPEGELSIGQLVDGTQRCGISIIGTFELTENNKVIEIKTSTTKPNQFYELSFEGWEGEFYHLYGFSDDEGQIEEKIHPSDIPQGGILISMSVRDSNDATMKFFPYPAMMVNL